MNSSVQFSRLPYGAAGSFAKPRWLELATLFVLIVTATALTYMWFWRLPYWLWFCGAAGGVLIFPKGLQALEAVLRASRWRIILPWMGFLGVIVLRDGSSGELASSLTDRVALNFASLVLFLVCAVLAYRCDWRHVLILLGVVGFGYGLIAIGQFSGSYTFWVLPDMISAYSSRDMALDRAVHAGVSAEDIIAGFERVGRARALDIYVHKFSAYQGIIAGMMLSVALALWWSERRHRGAVMAVAVSAFVTTLGVALTFSRAPIFGLICALPMVFWLARRQGSFLPLLGLMLFGGALAAAGALLGVREADQFGRIFELSASGSSDASRYQSWFHSLSLFASSPFIGVGSSGMAGADLVTHNVPLRILGDFGLAGFLCYAAVWLNLLHQALQTLRRPEPAAVLIGMAVMASLLVALFDNLTHSSGLLQRDTSQAAIFGIGYGLTLSVTSMSGRGPEPRHPDNLIAWGRAVRPQGVWRRSAKI